MNWRGQVVCDRCHGAIPFGGWALHGPRGARVDGCSLQCAIEALSRLLPADGGDTAAVETTNPPMPASGWQHHAAY